MRPMAFGVVFGIGSLVSVSVAGQVISIPELNASCYFVGQGTATQKPPSYTPAIPYCCIRPPSYALVTNCMNPQTPSNYVPVCNGCGPINNPQLSGKIDFVATFGNVDFTPACNFHDTCYGTCATINTTLSKDYCDNQFLTAMTDACSSEYGPLRNNDLVVCNHLANAYYKAVQMAGETPYEKGQIASCFCCDEGIVVGCSDAGVDDAGLPPGFTGDPNTGLMWRTPWSSGYYTQPGGVKYCKGLGMSLPSLTQLQTLIGTPIADDFAHQMFGEYWSATITSGQAGYVFFDDTKSETGTDFPIATYQVRCVR